MFEFAIALSLLLLILAERATRFGGGWIASLVAVTLVVNLLLPYVPLALLSLGLIAVICMRSALATWKRRAAAMTIVYVASFGVAAELLRSDVERLASLRKQHDFISLEERLPPRAVAAASVALNEVANQRLARIEADLAEKGDRMRGHLLRSLHEQTVVQFTNSPGFGMVRMIRPSERNLTPRRKFEEVVPQPHCRDLSAGEAEDPRAEPLAAESAMEDLHRDNVVDFANPEGFGYVKDQKVAGFQSHGFWMEPYSSGQWSVAAVDLVGLLLDENPRVYESKNLPRMDELKNSPTRPLDRFEMDGLERIRGGEDLVVAQTASGVRMLGAIRSAKQCLQCHQGNRGDLLGAFTYRLERKL
jgi:hypothetical protein